MWKLHYSADAWIVIQPKLHLYLSILIVFNNQMFIVAVMVEDIDH